MEERIERNIAALQEQLRQGRISRRDFLRYATTLGASLLTAQGLAACAPETAEPATATSAPAAATSAPATATSAPATATPLPAGPQAGGTLKYAETGAFNSFNPWRMYRANASMSSQVYSRLIWKDTEGTVHNDMAEELEMSEDGTTLTVKMRENIEWHDGQKCKAQDFVNMFNYTKDPELEEDVGISKFSGLVETIESVEAADEYTVQFNFAGPTPMGLATDILDYWYAIRIDDKDDAVMQQGLPVGTGPFEMVEWEPNQFTRYVRHDGYHLEGYPIVDEWEFQRLERSETLVPNLQSEAVHGIGTVPETDVESLQQDENVMVDVSMAAGSILNIIVNHNLPPFDQPEVRQALHYSLNRQAMVDSVFYGIGAPTCSPFYHPASIGYREDLIDAHAFDLDKAAELLEQAGVSDLEFDIHTTPAFTGWKEYCLIWQADLAKIGVTLNVREVEQAKFYEIADDPNLQGNGVHPWATGRLTRDPAIVIFTQPQYVSPNKYGWQNDEFEQLAADGLVEQDPERRQEMYQRCNEIYLEDLPMLQVKSNGAVYAWSDRVENAFIDLIGYLRVDRASLAA